MNKIKIKKDVVYNKYCKNSIKIIHIADIHFSKITKKDKLDRIANNILAIKPNYVMVSGDIIDSGDIILNDEKISELIAFFKKIASSVNVIVSLGNHDMVKDYYLFFDRLNKLDNVWVLDNREYVDEFIYVTGFTLPREFYYNNSGDESASVFINYLDDNKKLLDKLPNRKVKIALIHSPIKLTNNDILSRLCGYDIILSGHTHDGMVPDFLKFLFRGNRGIISPYKKIFPKIAKGNIIEKINDKIVTIIITGGITKLSLKSAKKLSKLNFVYNIGINEIIIEKERGNNNE